MQRAVLQAGFFTKTLTSSCRSGLPVIGKLSVRHSSGADNNDDRLNDMLATYQGADHEFGPYREREQASDFINYHERQAGDITSRDQPMHLNASAYEYVDAEANRRESCKMDSHIDNYDKQGTISLHSVMQSMVPEPYQPVSDKQSPGSVNMPGGQQPQMSLKYTSEQRHGKNDPAGEIV